MLKDYMKELDLFYKATDIPFCVFDNTLKDVYRCPHIKNMECSKDTMQACIDRLAQVPEGKKLPVFRYSNFCFFAMLKLDEDMNILFGPVVSIPMTYHEFYEYNKSVILDDDMLHLYKISQKSPLMSLSRFISNIQIFVKMLFNVRVSDEEILSSRIAQSKEYKAENENLKAENTGIIVKGAAEFQKNIIHYMINGNIVEIKNAFEETDYFKQLITVMVPAEKLKSLFFGYASICCVVAIEHGIEATKAVLIFDTYISKNYLIKNINEHKALCMNIAVDYCEEIEKVNEIDVESPIVRKSMQYINSNIRSKISLSDLAEYCGVDKRTISRHFEEFCGKTASGYIMQQKLNEAAFLLADTDMKISEIGEQLSFSSQSHLNTAFKKQYSCTPQMYRNINRNNKK